MVTWCNNYNNGWRNNMAYNVEEQQDIDNFKHFWSKGGKWLFILLVVAALAYLGYTLSKSYAKSQDEEAAALAYQFVEKSSKHDASALADLKTLQEKHGKSFGAAEATLMAAAQAFDDKKYDQAEKHLLWVQKNNPDVFIQALSNQRLAIVKLQQQQYDAALIFADANVPAELKPMMLETKGDILAAKGDKTQAKAAYAEALKGLDKDKSPNYELLKFKAEQ